MQKSPSFLPFLTLLLQVSWAFCESAVAATAARGCGATSAPTGYIGSCSAGATCSGISCDNSLGYFAQSAFISPRATCNPHLGRFVFSGCVPGCNATAPPVGYVGNCSAGSECTGITCDKTLGYFPYSLWFPPKATCNGRTPGAPFQFSGCVRGCNSTTAPKGYLGNCSTGLTCKGITCDAKLGYYPYPRWADPCAMCENPSEGFEFHGCALGCNATLAPVGYVGDCPAGITCTNITCAAGYFPYPEPFALAFPPRAACTGAPGSAFQYSGCVRGCNATVAPKGFVGNCTAGVTCKDVTCAPGYFGHGTAVCNFVTGGAFQYFGCIKFL